MDEERQQQLLQLNKQIEDLQIYYGSGATSQNEKKKVRFTNIYDAQNLKSIRDLRIEKELEFTNLNKNDSIVSFKKSNIIAGETSVEQEVEVVEVKDVSPNRSLEIHNASVSNKSLKSILKKKSAS